MSLRSPLLALALGLAAACAASPAAAQERLHLETFGDQALHHLTLPVGNDPVLWALEGTLGAEGDAALGAAPSPAWPFAVTEGAGFGLRHGSTDVLQLHVDTVVPLPIAPLGKAGSMSAWDLELADRLHAQIGLGGIDDDGKLDTGHGGVDLSLDGGLAQSGTYTTSFVRRDIGPFPFLEGTGRFTAAPRINLDKEIGLVFPVAGELHGVDVDEPRGDYRYTSERFSTGVAVKPYDPDISSGLFELLGVGWEKVSFTPPPGAPRPALGGAERFDLRIARLDPMTFSKDNTVEGVAGVGFGGDWIHDPTGKASLATFSATASLALYGSPSEDLSRSRVGAGFGFVYDGITLADGSALTRRLRYEGFIEGFALGGRAGGSVRAAAEQLVDVDPGNNPFRGAVAAEWYFAPIKPLQLGVDFTSTQQCVSSATAAGPAWCHRFGLFLRGAFHASKAEPKPPPPPPETPQPPAPVQQVPVLHVAQ